ncbi:hypothetical protein ACFL4G_00425 [Thermodesulfobacteriota bacterium]
MVPSKFLDADGQVGWIVSSILNAFGNDYYRYAMRRIFIDTAE